MSIQKNTSSTHQTIGPREAQRLLNTAHEQQRNLQERRVDKFAQEMLAGRWVDYVGQIVILNGHLADGQHRLSAVALSKIPCKFNVTETNNEKMMDVIDTGPARTMGWLLAKKYGFKSANICAAIGAFVASYDEMIKRGWSAMQRSYQRNAATVLVLENRDLIQTSADVAVKLYKPKRLVTPAISGTQYFICSRAGYEDEVKAFLEAALTGVGLQRRTPEFLLHEKLFDYAVTRSKRAEELRPITKLHFCLRAFLFSLNGEKPSKLVIGKEFPRIKNRDAK